MVCREAVVLQYSIVISHFSYAQLSGGLMTYKLYVLNAIFVLQAIVYEGQDKNPEMCRVLLTHEVMCR